MERMKVYQESSTDTTVRSWTSQDSSHVGTSFRVCSSLQFFFLETQCVPLYGLQCCGLPNGKLRPKFDLLDQLIDLTKQ